MIVCQQCGYQNDDDDQFCGGCPGYLPHVGLLVEEDEVEVVVDDVPKPELEERGLVQRVVSAVRGEHSEAELGGDASAAVAVDVEQDAEAERVREAEAEAHRVAAAAEAEAERARSAEAERARVAAAEAERAREAQAAAAQARAAQLKAERAWVAEAEAERAKEAAAEVERAKVAAAAAERARAAQAEAERTHVVEAEQAKMAAAETERAALAEEERAREAEARRARKEAVEAERAREAAVEAERAREAEEEAERTREAAAEAERARVEEAERLRAAEEAAERARRAAAMVAKAPPPEPPPPPARAPSRPPRVAAAARPVTATEQGEAPAASARQPAAQQPAPPQRRAAPTRKTPPSRVIEPGDLICGRCGEPNKPERRFCRRCAESLDEAEVAKTPWWRRVFHRKPKVVAAGERPGRPGRPGSTARSKKGKAKKLVRRAKWWVRSAALVATLLVGLGVLGPWRGPVQERIEGVYQSVRNRVAPELVTAGIDPTGTRASSEVPEHPGSFATDGADNRHWTALEPGEGAFLVVRFTEPVDLRRVGFLSGASGDAFLHHPRPREVHLVYDTGGSDDIELLDQAEFQDYPISATGVTEVQVHVRTLHLSTEGNNQVSITNIQFSRVR